VTALGLARRLVSDLERRAATRGLNVIRLGTHRALTEAIQLYRTSGYTETPAYGAVAHTDLWFDKRLALAQDRSDDQRR
jgi:GNAT superfamily N-acetyltransferase